MKNDQQDALNKICNKFLNMDLKIIKFASATTFTQVMMESRIAKELDFSIISAAQLVRDRYSDNTVRLDNIRKSGDFEQDASLVLGLKNEYVNLIQNNQFQDTVQSSGKQIIVITVLKNRDGIIGKKVDFVFDEYTHVINPAYK